MLYDRKVFTGKINNKTVQDLNLDMSDYKETKVDDRLKIVKEKLDKNDDFVTTYFSDVFNANLSDKDCLSDKDNVCNELEKMANYILGADEVLEERRNKRQHYKFYTDTNAFKNAVKKEESLDGKLNYCNSKINNTNSENNNSIIDFLLKKGKTNFKKEKTIKILKSDLSKDTYSARVLRNYQVGIDYISKAIKDIKTNPNSKFKGKRYILTKIKKDLNYDMLYCKEHLNGIFGGRPKNLILDSTKPSWELFDWENPKQVKELLRLKKDLMPDDDLSILVFSLEELLKEMAKNNCFTRNEIDIINLIRKGYKNIEISETLQKTPKYISKAILVISKKISKYVSKKYTVTELFNLLK